MQILQVHSLYFPLGVLVFMDISQTKVSLDRISTYLNEDEVTEQVSTLKKANVYAEEQLEEDGLGIENGSFKWNEVDEVKADKNKDIANKKTVASNQVAENESDATNDEGVDCRFELRDINILFPEGRLTVIAGPTASGKTALLVPGY
jgi:ABC-type multidrug transport system fused ATPase/permease subunit